MPTTPSDDKLPSGWARINSKSRPGECYYMNKKTGEKTWKRSEITKKESNKRKRSMEENEISNGSNKRNLNEEVQVLHLLVKHVDSRRASSWRQEVITRSKDVAISRLEGLRNQIILASKNNENPNALREKMEELARTESDCSSAKRGGDLGKFGRGKMQPSFEKASFELPVGELSEIIESDSGVHIIYRLK